MKTIQKDKNTVSFIFIIKIYLSPAFTPLPPPRLLIFPAFGNAHLHPRFPNAREVKAQKAYPRVDTTLRQPLNSTLVRKFRISTRT